MHLKGNGIVWSKKWKVLLRSRQFCMLFVLYSTIMFKSDSKCTKKISKGYLKIVKLISTLIKGILITSDVVILY